MANYAEYLATLEGGAVAELLVRLLVRSSYDDVRFWLLTDALVQIGQVRGASSKELVEYLGWDLKAKAGAEQVLNTLVSKGIARKADKEYETGGTGGKVTLYMLDYLWAFAVAETRLKYVNNELGGAENLPSKGYVCTRCSKTYEGAFAIFELTHRGDHLYCPCSGAVEEQTISKNAALAALKTEADAHLTIFEAILNHKKNLYIPSDADSITNSADILTHKQYRAYKEQAGVKLFQSAVWNMDMSSVKKLKTAQNIEIKLMRETKEQRVRREVETKKRKRSTAPHFPWLGVDRDKTKVQYEEDAEGADSAPDPQAQIARSLGHDVLCKPDIMAKRYLPETYAFYLKETGCDVHGLTEEFITVSHYLTEKNWPK
eukprot:TRINITY_DN9989_c0_g1_i1.p1 TRINITY_DN9989_c0_g1~~TRINITY_DN9989_c0_g1_i1.p1  ORF type:complete len:374 (+),score=49.14 TRINITY_DN9989_c0_g1_i1:166-1287(+)